MLALIDAPIPSLFVSTPIEFMPLIIVDPPAAPFATLSLRRNIGSVASTTSGFLNSPYRVQAVFGDLGYLKSSLNY